MTKKGPFILRALVKGVLTGLSVSWDGCAFMSRGKIAPFCTLPENAKRFATLEAATQGIVEWTLRYPAVIGSVEVVDLNSFEWE